ncbi:MAG: Transposase [Candidatus Alkanophagales archaeon MCA70_species_1]|nr:Transposase [Candidatus Alkanophaga volatiphilum]
MLISYKFRIYPSKTTEARLNEQLELCRWLYNKLLEEVNKARKEGRKITRKDTQALIVELKQEKPELRNVYSKVLQMVNYQLWANIKALSQLKKNGKKVGWLRYKTGNSFKTLNFNQSGFKIDFERGKLVLSKVGEIPIKIHRPLEGVIKGVIIKRTKSGKWYGIVQAEVEQKPLPPTGKVIGIDVGVRYFLTDTDGRQVENPHFYEKTLKRIKKLQKDLSRKQKGSKNWEKTRMKLAKAYEKLVNQRNDFLHKLSRFYIDNYDVIAVEDLRIQNMVRVGRTLAQRILDASWGKFVRLLSYKAERAGRRVVKVNPRGTSEGLTMDDPYRDYISACRIKNGGSGSGRPSEPVERRPLLLVTAKAVIEGQVSSMKQEAPLKG